MLRDYRKGLSCFTWYNPKAYGEKYKVLIRALFDGAAVNTFNGKNVHKTILKY